MQCFFGGFLFDENGNESKQLDVIVTTDTSPRFDFLNLDGAGKSFAPIEGTLGVASIKSMLDKNQLEDALLGIASIPLMKSLEGRISILIRLNNYEDWPYKIIYSTNGLSAETIIKHLNSFYSKHSDIPLYRRPNIIHVAGKYTILRITDRMTMMNESGESLDEHHKIGLFYLIEKKPDLTAIVWILDSLQQNALASTKINFSYPELINKIILV